MKKIKRGLQRWGLSTDLNPKKWDAQDVSGVQRYIQSGPRVSDPTAHKVVKQGLAEVHLSAGSNGKTLLTKAMLAIFSSPWFRKVNDVRAYGATVGSTADVGEAMRDMLEDVAAIRLPTGELTLSSTVEAETADYVWHGLSGEGHRTELKVDSTGLIKIQTQVPGGGLADDYNAQWTPQGVSKLTLNGLRDIETTYPGGASPYGLIIGTDTDSAEITVDNSANGMAFDQVAIYGFVIGAAHGFVTGVSWSDCEIRYCGVGMRFVTNSNNSASDGWSLRNVNFLNNELAALAIQAETVNDLTGNIIGGFFNGSIGWGIYCEHSGAAPGNYTAIGTHFERCGRRNTVERDDVTVPGSSLTIEPKGVYISNAKWAFIGCRFGNSAVHVAPDGFASFENCAMPTAVAGGGGTDIDLTPLYGTEKGARIEFKGGNTFTNPAINTLGTIDWQGQCRVNGTTNDKQFIQSRIPMRTQRIIGGKYSDPTFATGTSGFAVSNTNPPTINYLPTGGMNGAPALECVFGSTAGGQNSNALRPPATGGIDVNEYMACNMLLKADADTTLKVFSFCDTNNNNMGTATVELFAGEWTKIGILWHFQFGAADTNVLLGIYPQGTDAPTITIDCMDVEVGTFDRVLPFLQGCVGGA